MYMSSNKEDKSQPASSSSFDISGANTSGTSPQGSAAAGSAAGVAMMLLIPILGGLWFAVGSWQLSLFIDQIKCHKGDVGCLLPTDTNNFPYKNPQKKTKSGVQESAMAAVDAVVDITKLKLGQILGVRPKPKPKHSGGGRRRKRYVQRGGQSGGQGVDNILTSIDINGFRPFDIFNGPVQMPYSLAYEEAPWYEPSFLNFGKWFGHMQITAWSTARMALSGYLAGIGALLSTKSKGMNYWTRLLITVMMPLLLAIPLFIAPLVSFLSCIWGMFKGGYNYLFAIIFFLVPCITIITMTLQHLALVAYFLIGGILGSGQKQIGQNFSGSSSGGYLGILQTGLLLLLIGLLVIVIMGEAKKSGMLDTTESFSTKSESDRAAFSSNFS